MKAIFKKRGRSRNKFFNRNLIFIFIISIVLVIITVMFASSLTFLDIKKFTIGGDQLSCANFDQIKRMVEKDMKNLYSIDERKIKDELKKNFICLLDVRFQKRLPDEIKIEVFRRTPVAIFLSRSYPEATRSSLINDLIESTKSANISLPQSSDNSFLIDTEGVLFEKYSGNLEVPKIYYLDGNLTLGERFDRSLTDKIIVIFQKLNLFAIYSSEFILTDELLIYYSDPKIIFKLDETIETQLASLQLILEKAKIDSDILEFIDLRFDKPVIRYGQRQNNLRH